MSYARIRMVSTGLVAPSKLPSYPQARPVHFILVLEPLLFGVFPASLTPVVLSLVPLLGLLATLAPFVVRYVQGLAVDAKNERKGHGKEE